MVNAGHPQVIEIWNLVFMQFNRKANGSLEELPARNVDTGMGFERLCMILQGKKSNYDTDVFQPTIGRMAQLSGKTYGADAKCDVAMRVIADHLRAIAFSIADGQLPSNVKAGYVIRRILRRAVRYGYTYLGFTEPTICKLVAGLVEQMGGQFPELKAQQALIEKVIEEEEASFLRTLATGISLLDGVIAETKKRGPGADFGQGRLRALRYVRFPDRPDGADRPRTGRRRRPRSLSRRSCRRRRSVRATPPPSIPTTGWSCSPSRERLHGLRHADRAGAHRPLPPRHVQGKTSYQLVFDRTPFYGNSGGQIGDIGYHRECQRAHRRRGHRQGERTDYPYRRRSCRRTPRPISRPWWTLPNGRPRPTTIPPRTSCTRRCARCWARMSSRRVRW